MTGHDDADGTWRWWGDDPGRCDADVAVAALHGDGAPLTLTALALHAASADGDVDDAIAAMADPDDRDRATAAVAAWRNARRGLPATAADLRAWLPPARLHGPAADWADVVADPDIATPDGTLVRVQWTRPGDGRAVTTVLVGVLDPDDGWTTIATLTDPTLRDVCRTAAAVASPWGTDWNGPPTHPA